MASDIDPRRWAEVQGVFHELIALEPADRTSRLAAIGATDPALRDVVESLLVADAKAEARLAPLEATFRSGSAPAPDLLSLAGRSISHFHVLEPLGAGGMGVVYRAEDTRLGRSVALKFLLPQYSLDAAAKERFLREAHSAAALDHTNLCTIHEVGESEDGRLFLAMALYPGKTLKTRLAQEGALPVGAALATARQIIEGLTCAHAAGIVHRDLKPGNVMLLPDGTVKILDFGLAKVRDQSLSGTSARLGTVAYMAPEQIRGEAVDARADLWALGVVLYEMLTGRQPFAAEHDAATAHAVVYDEPTRLSTIRDDVPAAAEELILTLLEKDPDRRYATAQDLLRTLADIPSFPRPGIGLRWRRTVRRRRGLIIGALATLGVMTAVWVALLVGRSRHPDAAPTPVVVMPFENRSTDHDLDALGAMIADWVARGLTQAPFLSVLEPRSALAAAHTLGHEATPVAVGRETGAGVVVAGSYFVQDDSLHFQAEITSTADGSILLGIGEIAASRRRPLDGVEQLRQRVLAALASLNDRDVTSFQTTLAQPPTYAAYREYTEGLESYLRTAWMEAARHFQRAAELDSSFLVARLWAAQSWDGVDNARANSILHGLEPLRDRLSSFDRARFDFVVALLADDLQEAYRASLRMVEAAPGSVDARREAALSAFRVLRPREALKRLRELDPERGLLHEWVGYWSAVAWTQHMLGEHQDELAAARRGRQLYPSNVDFRFLELRALVALGRVVELDSMVRSDFPTFPGQIGILARAIAGELLAHGHAESARRLAHYAAELLAVHPPSEQASREWLQQYVDLLVASGIREVSFPSLFARLQAGSTSPWEVVQDEWLHQRAELALLLGDAEAAGNFLAQLRHPDAHPLLIARVAGAQGRREVARAALERAERRFLDDGERLRGFALHRASVLVTMGDLEGAVETLAEGLGPGLIRDSQWGNDGHALPDLAPLWPDPRFRALIKPRG